MGRKSRLHPESGCWSARTDRLNDTSRRNCVPGVKPPALILSPRVPRSLPSPVFEIPPGPRRGCPTVPNHCRSPQSAVGPSLMPRHVPSARIVAWYFPYFPKPVAEWIAEHIDRPSARGVPDELFHVSLGAPVYGASCVGVGKGSRKWSEEELKALEIGVVGGFARGCHDG